MSEPSDARGVSPSELPLSDLDAILRTLREVEVSLERRFARAEAAFLMIWGLVGASIFAFYQIVELDHARWGAILGPWTSWAWIAPTLAGYVASAIVGARLGRMGADQTQRRDLRRGVIPGILVALLVTVLILTERYQFIYGGVTAISGLALIVLPCARPRTRTRDLAVGIGIGMIAMGTALLAWWDHTWTPGIAAVTFLLGYLTLGTVKYRTGG